MSQTMGLMYRIFRLFHEHFVFTKLLVSNIYDTLVHVEFQVNPLSSFGHKKPSAQILCLL